MNKITTWSSKLFVCCMILSVVLSFAAGCESSSGSGEINTDNNTNDEEITLNPMDFYAAFPVNISADMNPAQSFIITGKAGITVTVSAPWCDYSREFVTNKTGTVIIDLPVNVDGMQDVVDTVQKKGFIIHSEDTVSVTALSDLAGSMATYTIPPMSQIGTEYYAICAGQDGSNKGSFISILATSDTTSIQILPAADANGHNANEYIYVYLDKYETYEIQADSAAADMTGSYIISDKPIVVFSGHAYAALPYNGTTGSFLCAVIPPVNYASSTEFFTIPFSGRKNYTVRIAALQNGTNIQRTTGTPASIILNRGGYTEFTASDAQHIITSSPVIVAQYSLSGGTDDVAADQVFADPSMVIVQPVSRFMSSYTVTAPPRNVSTRYAGLVVRTDSAANIRLNGSTIGADTFTRIGDTDYSMTTLSLPAGGNLFDGNGTNFSLLVYGWGETSEPNQFSFTPGFGF